MITDSMVGRTKGISIKNLGEEGENKEGVVDDSLVQRQISHQVETFTYL